MGRGVRVEGEVGGLMQVAHVYFKLMEASPQGHQEQIMWLSSPSEREGNNCGPGSLMQTTHGSRKTANLARNLITMSMQAR